MIRQLKNFQTRLYKSIPLVKHMQLALNNVCSNKITAFAPIAPNINDKSTVFGGSSIVRVNSFLIFDRWGEPVHQLFSFSPNDLALGWDGMHRGERANLGVYTFFAEVEFIDGEIILYEGDISLIR